MGQVIELQQGRELQLQRSRPVELSDEERSALKLRDGAEIDQSSQLLSTDRLASLRQEIAASNVPAGRAVAARAFTVLMASFEPKGDNRFKDERQMKIFSEIYIDNLAKFPSWVLNTAVALAPVEFKTWRPSIGEMVELCNREWSSQHLLEHRIGQMETEHRRRQVEAERQAKRELQRRAWLAELARKSRERFGNDAPLPGDLELARELRPNVCVRHGKTVSWLINLAAEAWAATFCRRLALIARLQRAHQQGKASGELASKIASLVIDDEAGARRQIEAIEVAAAALHCSEPSGFDVEFFVNQAEAAAGLVNNPEVAAGLGPTTTGRRARNRTAVEELTAISPRRLGQVLAETRAFKLPEPDDPRVLQILAEMGE